MNQKYPDRIGFNFPLHSLAEIYLSLQNHIHKLPNSLALQRSPIKMGGLVFSASSPPLPTPRMPSHIYTRIRDHLLSTLRTLYTQAECPVEAPGKPDYGDIDILVMGALHDEDENFNADRLALILGAVKHQKTSGSATRHFAVPWPEEEGNEVDGQEEKKYIQLDLHHCTSSSSFTWSLFHQSHGDLWNILGATIRHLGLTPSDTGLYIRIPVIEARNRNAARVLLTTSPSETLRFLGLDEKKYTRKFGSVEELFEYAASCRFFDPGRFDPKRWDGERDLRSNDRRRTKKRAVFRRWVEEYLPGHAADEAVDQVAVKMTREEVAEESMGWFGVREVYEERRRVGIREMGREGMWMRIRKEVGIEGDCVGVVTRGVKREVAGEVEELVDGEGNALQRAYADDDFETVVELVKESRKAIEERQRAYEKEKSTKNLLAKIRKTEIGGRN